MTKPKPKLKPFKRVMWVHAARERVADVGQVVFLYPKKARCACYGEIDEVPTRVLVTIRPWREGKR